MCNNPSVIDMMHDTTYAIVIMLFTNIVPLLVAILFVELHGTVGSSSHVTQSVTLLQLQLRNILKHFEQFTGQVLRMNSDTRYCHRKCSTSWGNFQVVIKMTAGPAQVA
jgi:hypothetical protein